MKNKKFIYSITALLTILTIAVSCERLVDDLELATYPTTAEVFIDEFSSGLYYSAYGTSKVTAFSVDKEVKYSGAASMRFDVPDQGDPNGSYVGGVFGTNPGRDLTGYNVLTFWAKASQPATLNEAGFGNDMGESKYKVTATNIAVNSNWTKYYIPFPDPSVLKQERGMFFYSAAPLNEKGYTFWIDEVKFENIGTIAHPSFGILNGCDSVKNKAEISEVYQIADLYGTFNLPTGIDQKVSLSGSYFTYSSSSPSIASVDDLGKVLVVDSGSAVITAKVGDLNANGSLTINSVGKAVGPNEPAPTPTHASQYVISLYSNAYTNVTVDSWNTRWQYSTAENQFVQIQGDDAIRYRNLNFVGIEFTSQPVDASDMAYFHMDIWTPDPTSSKTFKVMLVDFGANGVYGGGDDVSSEVSITSPTLTTKSWISLNIPMSSFTGLTTKSHLAQMVLSGDLPNIYLDNVYFYNNGPAPTEPTTAAPAPTRSAANVISLFSDAYTNVIVDTWRTDWSSATLENVTVAGNATKKYSSLDYVGIETTSNLIDATAMTYIHLDVWSANFTNFGIKLVDFGANGTYDGGGDDKEHQINFAAPVQGSWISYDIPLSDFTGLTTRGHMAQYILVGQPSGAATIYVDNVYFYKEGGTATEPTTAAPTPTRTAANVISIFSDAYTNVGGTDFNPNWGQSTVVSQVPVAGNNTLKYAGLNYQGIALGSNQDVSGMGYLHLDFWTANSTLLKVYLISPGPVETPYSLTVPSSGWTSVDIPLSSFSPVDLANIIQFKFDGNGDIWIDNIYFYKSGTGAYSLNSPIDFESSGYGAGWTWNVFENSTGPALQFVSNPNPSGINTSATVAKFTALQAGQPWAGCETQHGDMGTFTLDAAHSIVKIMVYKTVLSDVGIKFAKSDGWSMGEIKVPNTVVNAWQELTFNFTAQIQAGYDQIIIFPDFNLSGRTSDNVIYFDNITFSASKKK